MTSEALLSSPTRSYRAKCVVVRKASHAKISYEDMFTSDGDSHDSYSLDEHTRSSNGKSLSAKP